jgi:hypothetical protein
MKSRKIEYMSGRRWDLAWTTATNFICVVGDSVMIRFMRKDVFLFQ